MSKKKSTLGKHIKELGERIRELDEQVAEIEAQINHPLRSPKERRMLRAHWEKTIDEYGLRPFVQATEKKEPRRRVETSGQIISNALYLKQQAKFFENAGRMDDAKRMRAKA